MLPFRRLFRRNPLLRPGALLLLKSLPLGLRTRRSIVVGYFLGTCVGRALLIYSVGMSLQPFVVAVDDRDFEVSEVVEDVLPVLRDG